MSAATDDDVNELLAAIGLRMPAETGTRNRRLRRKQPIFPAHEVTSQKCTVNFSL